MGGGASATAGRVLSGWRGGRYIADGREFGGRELTFTAQVICDMLSLINGSDHWRMVARGCDFAARALTHVRGGELNRGRCLVKSSSVKRRSDEVVADWLAGVASGR